MLISVNGKFQYIGWKVMENIEIEILQGHGAFLTHEAMKTLPFGFCRHPEIIRINKLSIPVDGNWVKGSERTAGPVKRSLP